MNKVVWLLALALVGCANPGGGSSSSGSSTGSPALETEARAKARVFSALGFEYYKNGQMKVALEQARKAIATEKNFGPAYHLMALVYMDIEEDMLAEENFRKAIDLDRTDSDAHNSYGRFLCTRGRYDEGQAQFTEAMRNPLYDKPEQAMTNAGLCSEKKGDLKQAEAYYNKALKLQPLAPQPIIRLATLNYNNNNMSEAQRLVDRFLEVSPPTAEAYWLALRIERKQGDKSQEAYYGAQLRKRFSDAPETQSLLRGEYQ